MPKMSTQNEINLTIFGEEFETVERASANFEAAMRQLETGTTVEIQGEMKTMFKYDTEEVEGVGENARWVAGMNQVSVHSGKRVFHLGVKLHDTSEENKADAITLAVVLCEKIK